jgi:spore maturation protein CgeB
MLECVRQALASRDERQRRGRAARERILREHTYRQRAAAIVEALKASRPAAQVPRR